MSNLIQILKALSALIDLLELWIPEKGQGQTKLQKALELITELWNDGEQLVTEKKDLLIASISKLVFIKNILSSWRK